ncbi:MAG: hypothetical protein IJW58_02280 [Clostridia bacterium]|nr:hypothetical protein [Clostridia bacterium]
MAKKIQSFLQRKNSILETVSYGFMAKNTKVEMQEYTKVLVEQKGKTVGGWSRDYGVSTTKNFTELAPNAKPLLFLGYNNITVHYLNTNYFSINRKYEGKTAGGGTAYYSGKITFRITEVDVNKFAKWAKDNKFKKNGDVWLNVAQAQNLIGNLFLEKGFESVLSRKTLASGHRIVPRTATPLRTNDDDILQEVVDFVNSNVERWGMRISISFS